MSVGQARCCRQGTTQSSARCATHGERTPAAIRRAWPVGAVLHSRAATESSTQRTSGQIHNCRLHREISSRSPAEPGALTEWRRFSPMRRAHGSGGRSTFCAPVLAVAASAFNRLDASRDLPANVGRPAFDARRHLERSARPAPRLRRRDEVIEESRTHEWLAAGHPSTSIPTTSIAGCGAMR
jgi:hypothetical protein